MKWYKYKHIHILASIIGMLKYIQLPSPKNRLHFFFASMMSGFLQNLKELLTPYPLQQMKKNWKTDKKITLITHKK